MSFIQRELGRLQGALLDPANAERYDRLYAAQQALAWAAEPEGFRSPHDMIMGAPVLPATGIREGSEGCLGDHRPPPS